MDIEIVEDGQDLALGFLLHPERVAHSTHGLHDNISHGLQNCRLRNAVGEHVQARDEVRQLSCDLEASAHLNGSVAQVDGVSAGIDDDWLAGLSLAKFDRSMSCMRAEIVKAEAEEPPKTFLDGQRDGMPQVVDLMPIKVCLKFSITLKEALVHLRAQLSLVRL